jgi:hypothetical protein
MNKAQKLRRGVINVAKGLSMYIINKSQKNKDSSFKVVTPTANLSSRGTFCFFSSSPIKTIVANKTGVMSTSNVDPNVAGNQLVGALNSGFIKFGDVDLGHKKTNFVSGDDIFGIGSNIVFHNDFALAAKDNISFTLSSSIEAHVSGFNKTFTAIADTDRLNGEGFNLSSESFIRTQGVNVNITGNSISPSGNNSNNIITNGGNYNRNIRITTVTANEANESPLAEFIEEVLEGEILVSSALRRFLNSRFKDVRDGDDIDDILGVFPDKNDEEVIKIIEDNDQVKQVSLLADFLDSGGINKPNC